MTFARTNLTIACMSCLVGINLQYYWDVCVADGYVRAASSFYTQRLFHMQYGIADHQSVVLHAVWPCCSQIDCLAYSLTLLFTSRWSCVQYGLAANQ